MIATAFTRTRRNRRQRWSLVGPSALLVFHVAAVLLSLSVLPTTFGAVTATTGPVIPPPVSVPTYNINKNVDDDDTTLRRRRQQQQQQLRHRTQPVLLTPCDIVWDSTVREALRSMRTMTTMDDDDSSFLYDTALYPCYYDHPDTAAAATTTTTASSLSSLTATLVGYKGGSLMEQTNQDRAFVVVDTNNNNTYTVSGVMDGHGRLGHFVAEWSRHAFLDRLPHTLAAQRQARDSSSRSNEPLSSSSSTTTQTQRETEQAATAAALSDLIVEMDRDLPAESATQGGATLSLVLQVQDGTLYFCNAGDSQSFLVAVIVVAQDDDYDDENTNDTMKDDATQTDDTPSQTHKGTGSNSRILDIDIAFATKLDKPDDPTERIRLEAAGLHVVDATDDEDARVWYTAQNGQQYGLAMSRALGDRSPTVGVTAEPTVTVLRTEEVVAGVVQRYHDRQDDDDCPIEMEVDVDGSASTTTASTANSTCAPKKKITANQVHLFAVSATDGILDYSTLEGIGFQLAQALYEGKSHAMLAASDIIHQSSAKWHEDMRGQYRDDMAIAVTQIS